MFGKKKKNTIVNEVFGEMKYTYGWESTGKTEIILWNKKYRIDLFAAAETEKDGITEKQEMSYQSFKDNILERQKEVEEVIENYFHISDKQILASRFTPTDFLFCRNGNCGMYIDDAEDADYADDPNADFAITIIPEIKMISPQADYADYIFGEGSR